MIIMCVICGKVLTIDEHHFYLTGGETRVGPVCGCCDIPHSSKPTRINAINRDKGEG